jgi:hypothetical protein
VEATTKVEPMLDAKELEALGNPSAPQWLGRIEMATSIGRDAVAKARVGLEVHFGAAADRAEVRDLLSRLRRIEHELDDTADAAGPGTTDALAELVRRARRERNR